jgi:hypothetical protein
MATRKSKRIERIAALVVDPMYEIFLLTKDYTAIPYFGYDGDSSLWSMWIWAQIRIIAIWQDLPLEISL